MPKVLRLRACGETVQPFKDSHLVVKAKWHLIGKQWHDTKSPFRPMAGLSSYEQRIKQQERIATTKGAERQLKEEKESQRQVSFEEFIYKVNLSYLRYNAASHTKGKGKARKTRRESSS